MILTGLIPSPYQLSSITSHLFLIQKLPLAERNYNISSHIAHLFIFKNSVCIKLLSESLAAALHGCTFRTNTKCLQLNALIFDIMKYLLQRVERFISEGESKQTPIIPHIRDTHTFTQARILVAWYLL